MDLFPYLISRNKETSTVSGTEIDLTDAFDTRPRYLGINATETTQGENPSPDNPQDVETMVGYRNLFDKDNVTRIKAYFSSDTTWIYNDNSYSFRIPCKANANYIIYADNINETIFRAGVTDSENIPASSLPITVYSTTRNTDTNDPIIVNTGNEAKYIVIQVSVSQSETTIKSLMVIEGTEEKPYVPYGTNYMVLDEVGKNLFISDWEQGEISPNGVNVINPNVIRTKDYIKVEPNEHYSIKRNINTGYINVRGYDKNQNFIGSGGSVINLIYGSNANNPMQAGNSSCTIQPKDGVYYLKFNDLSNDLSTKYMMLKGDTIPQTYEPYQHKQYPISLANQELLNKNNYVDKIIVDESTGESYIEKLWGKVVLDGKENWAKGDDVNDNSYYYTPYYDSAIKAITNAITSISDKLTPIPNPVVVIKNNLYVATTWAHLRLYIDKNIFSGTASEFKTWLASNNITIYHLLATPQLIPIDNPNIKLLNGVNHITNSEGAEMDIVYVNSIGDLFNKCKYTVLEDDDSTNKCKKKRRC